MEQIVSSSRWRKLAIVLAILLVGVVIYFLAGIIAFIIPSCDVVHIQELEFRNAQITHEVVNCGATADHSTVVKVNTENIFVVEGEFGLGELSIKSEEEGIRISCKSCLVDETFRQIEEYQGIKFIYD